MNPGPFRLLVGPAGIREAAPSIRSGWAPYRPADPARDLDEPRSPDPRECPHCGCQQVVMVEHIAWNGMRSRRPRCAYCSAAAPRRRRPR